MWGKRNIGLAALLIAVAAVVAYANTFHAPFAFDDVSSIGDNPTIRQLWPPWSALSPPADWGFTVSGRPILNLSLAINYAISGYAVWSYHGLNLLIHALAGIALFGLIHATLSRETSWRAPSREHGWLALAIAVTWTVHPLQTESVTYVIQRAESLMGLFYFVSVYAFARATQSAHPGRWWCVSVAACLLGVATKETAATIPLVIFLYDRAFITGSFAAAWRRHRKVYLALGASWILLFALLAGTGGNRGGTFRFDALQSWIDYGLTQFEAIPRYVALTLWPHPLVFDYGKIAPPPGLTLALWMVPAMVLAALMVLGARRSAALAFLAGWFALILAPTTLAPGAQQMIVEHRMYLPLAALLTLLFWSARHYFGVRSIPLTAAIVIGAIVLTHERNEVYRSELSLWEQTAAQKPGNARARNNLGLAYHHLNRIDDAIACYRESLRLEPDVANTNYNLGLALTIKGQLAEAAEAFAAAIRILPGYFSADRNLGVVLMKLGRNDEALEHFAAAVRYDPGSADLHFQFGVALAQVGRWNDAIKEYTEAVRCDPRHAEAHSNWGVALLRLNKPAAAIEQFRTALQISPELTDVHYNLGLALATLGRTDEATTEYATAVTRDPNNASAQLNLGIALGRAGQLQAAIDHVAEAARLRPDWPEARRNLGTGFAAMNRNREALEQFQAALQLEPGSARAHCDVGYALLTVGRMAEARQELEEAIRLDPAMTRARDLLRQLDENASIRR